MQQAVRGQFEKFNASQYKIGIVVAQFNGDLTAQMQESAIVMCKKYSITEENMKICTVPGSVEIPVVLQALANNNYDVLVAIGVIIKGESAHFDYVCKMISEGVLRVMLDVGIPIGFGVLTAHTHEQAAARISAGGEAVEAALQSLKIIKEL